MSRGVEAEGGDAFGIRADEVLAVHEVGKSHRVMVLSSNTWLRSEKVAMLNASLSFPVEGMPTITTPVRYCGSSRQDR
jgi:hypothetical protein